MAWHTSAKRILGLLAIVAAVTASLLAFPAVLPWIVAAWVGFYSVSVYRGWPSWLSLLAIVAIVVVKNVDWPISVPVFLAIAALNLILVPILVPSPPPRGRGQGEGVNIAINARRWWILRLGSLVALWIAVGWIFSDWHFGTRSSVIQAIDPNKSIVCLGDSLTAAGYPGHLAALLSVEVVDWGRDGITSKDALALVRGPDGVLPPELVSCQGLILEIGGHDFNQGKSRMGTEENIQEIIEICQSRRIAVILVEIPRGFVRDEFGGIERSLARRFDLKLVSDSTIRWFVLYSPICPPGMWLPSDMHLSEDGLHPNERGNKLMARNVSRALVGVFGAEILER